MADVFDKAQKKATKAFGLDPVAGAYSTFETDDYDPNPKGPSFAKQDEGFASEATERQKYLQSLEGQVAAKRATADQFGGQIEASKAAGQAAQARQRRLAAQQLAGIQSRGMGGGGAILTLGNQAAADRGLAEAELAGKFRAQQEELGTKQALAREALAGAETEVSAERRKMLDVDRGYDAKVNAAVNEFRKRLGSKGWLFSTDADKAQILGEIKTEFGGTLPPAQRAELYRQLDAEAAKNVEGKWDI